MEIDNVLINPFSSIIRIISCKKMSKLYVLEKKGVSLKYIKVIKDMYNKTITSVRISGGITSEFLTTIGLNQGSTLSPYLFALVMDELTRLIQDEAPWCISQAIIIPLNTKLAITSRSPSHTIRPTNKTNIRA